MEPSPKDTAYIIGFVLTWVAGAFGIGRGVGRTLQKTQQLERDLIELKAKEQRDVDAIKAQIKAEFSRFEAYFRTADGDDRFLTERQHTNICGNQQKNLDELKHNQKEIYKTMEAIAISIAKIEQKIVNGKV